MTTKKEIELWLNQNLIINAKINDDLTIDVNGNVDLTGRGLTEIPYKFNRVEGDFNLLHNFLTSLKNVPNIVGKDFICSSNHLETLDFSPQTVKGSYYCSDNPLTQLNAIDVHFDEFFYHCTNTKSEFLKDFKTFYEKDEGQDYNYSLEMHSSDFLIHVEQLHLEKTIHSNGAAKKMKL